MTFLKLNFTVNLTMINCVLQKSSGIYAKQNTLHRCKKVGDQPIKTFDISWGQEVKLLYQKYFMATFFVPKLF